MSTGRIFLYSRNADFAPTRRLSESEYLGRAIRKRLALFGCGCALPRLARIRRAAWMRLIPVLRLYQCRRCQSRVLRRPGAEGLGYVVPQVHGRRGR